MSNWTMRIKTRMKELEMTQETLANKMGITRGAVTHYLSGRRVPPLKQFHKLATVLKVDPAWLQFGTTDAKSASKIDTKINVERAHQIPLLSWEEVANFVKGKEPANNKQEYVPHIFGDNENWFALKVKGDSMSSPVSHNKNFHEGEIIIVAPEKIASNGDFVLALLPQAKEVTFKQYIVDGGIEYLKPINPQYPIVELDKKVRIYGIVIGRVNLY